jgi:hypothetical protein
MMPGVCLLIGLAAGAPARGQAVGTAAATLRYWQTRASERSTPSGPSFFYLRARTDWAANASREPLAYQTRVVLPDGRVELRPLYRDQGPGQADGVFFLVPADVVHDVRPDRLVIRASVADAAGNVVSNELEATAEDFPRQVSPAGERPDPYRWRPPLEGTPGTAASLPTSSYAGDRVPGYQFVRLLPPGGTDNGAVFAATTEASMAQVNAAQAGVTYGPDDLKLGESVVRLDAPAYRLTVAQARAYLDALSKAEGLGVAYRLPTREEWERVAKAGRSTAFWWGDDPKSNEVLFLGNPSPTGQGEAASRPDEVRIGRAVTTSLLGYHPNPFGLWHTYGNMAEWATDPGAESTFWKLGGSFATETAQFRPEDLAVRVEGDSMLQGEGEQDPPQWVGVRPFATITPESGAKAIAARLAENPALADVKVEYDPARATATLTGSVASWDVASEADRLIALGDPQHRPLWFVASVENRLKPTALSDAEIARILDAAGSVAVRYDLGQPIYEAPVRVDWSPAMPVVGTDWWANVFRPGGERLGSTRIDGKQVGRTGPVTIYLPARFYQDAGLRPGDPVEILLSIGISPAVDRNDPRLVSAGWPLTFDPTTIVQPSATSPGR